MGFKTDIASYDENHSIKVVDCSLGYKFKNKLTLGFVLESIHLLDVQARSYKDLALPGIGIKYLVYELERNKDKRYSFEPYVNVLLNSSMDAFSSYDVGINCISIRHSTGYIGTGLKHYFFDDGSGNSLLSWYFSFGIRI